MRTFLTILGIWLLINVLFVVIMIPPRKPRKADHEGSNGLAPAPIGQNAYPFDEEEKVSLRHTIIAIAMGALFSLAPPLLQAVDDIKQLIGKYRKPRQGAEGPEGERSLDPVGDELTARKKPTTADGSLSGDHGTSTR